MSAVWFPEKERALATSLGASPRALVSRAPPHPLTCGHTWIRPGIGSVHVQPDRHRRRLPYLARSHHHRARRHRRRCVLRGRRGTPAPPRSSSRTHPPTHHRGLPTVDQLLLVQMIVALVCSALSVAFFRAKPPTVRPIHSYAPGCSPAGADSLDRVCEHAAPVSHGDRGACAGRRVHVLASLQGVHDEPVVPHGYGGLQHRLWVCLHKKPVVTCLRRSPGTSIRWPHASLFNGIFTVLEPLYLYYGYSNVECTACPSVSPFRARADGPGAG